jgi:hypothetical protein
MISHSKRFIFIHIPKSGGTSVEWALRKHGVWIDDDTKHEGIYYKHATARDLKRMLSDEFDKYFKFTVVRNPWDWAVSNYAFNRGLHGSFLRHTQYTATPRIPDWAKDWSFKQWLRWWIDTCSPLQSNMLTDSNGQLLVNHAIRFEDLRSQFYRVCWRMRVLPRPLQHIYKTTGRTHFESYYDDESRRWVAEHFAEDIKRFGYHFGVGTE